MAFSSLEIKFLLYVEYGTKFLTRGDLNVKRIDFDLGMRTDIIMADEIKVRIIATFEKM